MSLDCSQSKLPGNVSDAPSAPIVMEGQERGSGEGLGERLAALQPLGAERKVARAGKHPLPRVNGHRSSGCRPPSRPALDISIMQSLATCVVVLKEKENMDASEQFLEKRIGTSEWVLWGCSVASYKEDFLGALSVEV